LAGADGHAALWRIAIPAAFGFSDAFRLFSSAGAKFTTVKAFQILLLKRISLISWNELWRSSFHSIMQQALSVLVIWNIPCSETLRPYNSLSIASPHCEEGYVFWIAPSAHHFTARSG
jgi:hypothetical protein